MSLISVRKNHIVFLAGLCFGVGLAATAEIAASYDPVALVYALLLYELFVIDS